MYECLTFEICAQVPRERESVFVWAGDGEGNEEKSFLLAPLVYLLPSKNVILPRYAYANLRRRYDYFKVKCTQKNCLIKMLQSMLL